MLSLTISCFIFFHSMTVDFDSKANKINGNNWKVIAVCGFYGRKQSKIELLHRLPQITHVIQIPNQMENESRTKRRQKMDFILIVAKANKYLLYNGDLFKSHIHIEFNYTDEIEWKTERERETESVSNKAKLHSNIKWKANWFNRIGTQTKSIITGFLILDRMQWFMCTDFEQL